MKTFTFGRLTTVLNNAINLDQQKVEFKLWNDDATQSFIIDLVTFEQLFKQGVDGGGDPIGEYTAFTELLNQGQTFTFKGVSKPKLRGEPYTLFASGAFYASFKIIPKPDGFGVNADDRKADGTLLTNKYGLDILKPNDESNISLVRAITPFLVREIRVQLLK